MSNTFVIRASSPVLSKADEAQAIKYLKSLGITLRDTGSNVNGTGWVEFDLGGKKDTDNAISRLTKAIGKPETRKGGYSTKHVWKVAGKNRTIEIDVDLEDPDASTIALSDTEDYAVQRRLQRKDANQKLKPLKPIDRKLKPAELQLFAAIFTVTNLGLGSAKVQGESLKVSISNSSFDDAFKLRGDLSMLARTILDDLINSVDGDMAGDDIDAEYRGWLKDLKKDTLYSLAKVHTDMIDLCMYLAAH
jgi:hypothetical protein